MENYNNDIFSFGNEIENNAEQVNNFDYNNIIGLGESNYENEDLFKDDAVLDNQNNYGVNELNNVETVKYPENLNINNQLYNIPSVFNYTNTIENVPQTENIIEPIFEPEPKKEEIVFTPVENIVAEPIMDVEPQTENIIEPIFEPEPIVNDLGIQNIDKFEEKESIIEEPIEYTPIMEEKENTSVGKEDKIEISDTPIEELNKLASYEPETIETTNINSLFDKVSVNVKDASDIFRKNTEMKQKIDSRFDQLKKLQSELENSRQKQIDEVDRYKEEVLGKLTEKKEEIEKRLNLLKESQASLEKKIKEFEDYKKKEQDNIDRVQKEVQAAYDDRREELTHIEDSLRKQKDALDEERNQLSLDRIQYEADKNELANNLLKFNELVNSFTNSVNDAKE